MALYTPPGSYTVISQWKTDSGETWGHAIGQGGEDLGVIILQSPRTSEIGMLRGTTKAATGGGEVGEAELGRQQRIEASRVRGDVPYQVSDVKLSSGEYRKGYSGKLYQVRNVPPPKPETIGVPVIDQPRSSYMFPGTLSWKPEPMKPGYVDPRISGIDYDYKTRELYGTRTDLAPEYTPYITPEPAMVSMPSFYVPEIDTRGPYIPPQMYGTRTDLTPSFEVPATFPAELQPKWSIEKSVEKLIEKTGGSPNFFERAEDIYTGNLDLIYGPTKSAKQVGLGVVAGVGYFGYSAAKGFATTIVHPVETGKSVLKMGVGGIYELTRAVSPISFSFPSFETKYLIKPQQVLESFAYDPIGFSGQAFGGSKGFGVLFKGGQIGIRTGKLGIKKIKSFDYFSGKEIPETALFSKESLEGKAYPTGKSAESVLEKFQEGKIGKGSVLDPLQPQSIWSIEDYQARFNPTKIVTKQLKLDKVTESIGDLISEHAAETRIRGKEIGYSEKQALRPEDIGLYSSPTGEAMVKFLGLRKNFFEGIFEMPKDVRKVSTRNPLKILQREIFYEPTIELLKSKDVMRLPRNILESEGFGKVWEYEYGKSGEGVSFITARSERGFSPELRVMSKVNQVTRELEAATSYGTGLRRLTPTTSIGQMLSGYFGKSFMQPRVLTKSHTAQLGKLLPEYKEYKVISFEEPLPSGVKKGVLTRYQTEGIPIKKLQNMIFVRSLETVPKTKLSTFEKLQSKVLEQQLKDAGITTGTGDILRRRTIYSYKAPPVPKLFKMPKQAEFTPEYSYTTKQIYRSAGIPKPRGPPIIRETYTNMVPDIRLPFLDYQRRPSKTGKPPVIRIPYIDKPIKIKPPFTPRFPKKPGKPEIPPPRIPTITRPPTIPKIIIPRFQDKEKKRRKGKKGKKKEEELIYSPDILAKVLGQTQVVDKKLAKQLLTMKFTGFEFRPGVKGGIKI